MAEDEQKKHPWVMFVDRVLPPLFVSMCVALSGGMWATYESVNKLTVNIASQQRDIEALKSKISVLETSLVTKQEMLETMKRVEQQLEIMMLRAGVKPDRPVKLTGH